VRIGMRSCLGIALLLVGFLASSSRLLAEITSDKIKELRHQAELFEQQGEWDKACSVYESILRAERGRLSIEIQTRYQLCLRRYWQALRHADLSYRKEVLSLDYAQALRLYTTIRDTLIENALDKKKAEPANLLRKGMEEFDNALTDPNFRQEYLAMAKPSAIQGFRDLMKKTWVLDDKLTKTEALKQLRELTLAAQNALHLNGSVILMEFACGACHALDDYTLYLTPNQLRELCDSLRGEMMPSVGYQMKNSSVGYVYISSFQETTTQEVEEALLALAKDGMRSLILDLRGNNGGLFEVAIDVARQFLSSGIITSTQSSDAKFNTIYHARNPNAATMPMVVLIDEGTASAAEVLAGALKDNKRARLVGQTTFGKGCTQCILKLPNAPGGLPTGGMRLTIAQFFSPDGLPYTGKGVSPHLPTDLMLMGTISVLDNQMETALQEALRMLE
jgi:hypothetical protein